MRKYAYRLSVGFVPKMRNTKRVPNFWMENGTLLRHYVHDGKLYTEEFMYIHFFCRPMKYLQKNYNDDARYIIYPDCVKDFNSEIDVKTVKGLRKTRRCLLCQKHLGKQAQAYAEKIMFNIKIWLKESWKNKHCAWEKNGKQHSVKIETALDWCAQGNRNNFCNAGAY